jgi:hypothetical protein
MIEQRVSQIRYDGGVRGKAFEILTWVSVALLAVLAFGYVARFGPYVSHNAGGAKGVYRQVTLSLDRGRGVVFWEQWRGAPVGVAAGWHLGWRGPAWRLEAPDMKRSVWDFDAHPLPGGKAAWSTAYILACPIWCLALPVLVAPTIWFLKKRRSKEEARGFSVEQGEAVVAIER